MSRSLTRRRALLCALVAAPLLFSGCKKKGETKGGESTPGATAPEGPTSRKTTPAAKPVQAAESATVFGAKSRLAGPRGVAVDAAGNVFVADTANSRIVKLDAQGREVATIGRKGTGAGEFLAPWAVAVSTQGQLHVLDQGTGWIQIFGADGKYVSRYGGPAATFYTPLGLALASDGTAAVADTGGNRIVLFDAQGALAASLRKVGGQDLQQPTDVAFSSAGLFIVEPMPGPRATLIHASRTGEFKSEWVGVVSPSTSDAPRGVVAPDGRLFVTSPDDRRLAVFSADGATLTPIDFAAALPLPPKRLGGIALDGAGRLYVTDVEAGVVYRVQLPAAAAAKPAA